MENAEENFIMLRSVSSTPHTTTPDHIASESARKSSRKSMLVQIFTDFERLCKTFPGFIKATHTEDIQDMSTAIASIGCVPHKEH